MIEKDETTFTEVAHRIREGTFYEDYDWASGPALRALDDAEECVLAIEEGYRTATAKLICTCMEVHGEDPACLKHGKGTQWAKENPDFADTPDREQLDAWLGENCGHGLPYATATDLPSALHGLAYVLRQIEGTDRYMVNIGQCGPAASSIRWALEYIAKAEIARHPLGSQEGGA